VANDRSPPPDTATVEQLVAQDRERLIATANRIVRDRHEAEDVVQETLAAVWKRLPYIPADKLTNYLNRSVRQNALKRSSRRRSSVTLEESHQLDTGNASRFLDPMDLEDAIDDLPIGQQSVLRMKYYFGMTFQQIGLSLSISSNTAASRCRYALSKLRKKLSQEGEGPGHEQEN